jgi:hypothetical protein
VTLEHVAGKGGGAARSVVALHVGKLAGDGVVRRQRLVWLLEIIWLRSHTLNCVL